MKQSRRLYLLLKEIGSADLIHYARYQASLRSGRLQRLTPPGGMRPSRVLEDSEKQPLLLWQNNWNRLADTPPAALIATEAQLIQNGQFSPFFGKPQPLTFTTALQSDAHWSRVDQAVYEDIKFVWEPARFIWALSLARAYQISNRDSLVDFFWQMLTDFIDSNPVNLGPNWVSAQEVGIRGMMWLLAASALPLSQQRLVQLSASIYEHVRRVLPTLGYARSQHNNHILSESLFLILAGDALAGIDAAAQGWVQLGEREFTRAILQQVEDSGIYSQHSANYHRMMLQLALLYQARANSLGIDLPVQIKNKLAAATKWLIAQLDSVSGQVPNLGHNDGTLLLPFGCTDFRDYRPTAQAAARGFLGTPCLPPGEWDELSLWLGLEGLQSHQPLAEFSSPAVHKVGSDTHWGTLRAVYFKHRPAHADQLHADLWWDGMNIARDAGTYTYNLPSPWQNALDCSAVHNTITVNEVDQMTRVSRFLWLDQAQAKWCSAPSQYSVTASHNGYRQFNVVHQRTLKYLPESGFEVSDNLTRQKGNANLHYRLQWLLPDWGWQFSKSGLTLIGPCFSFQITVTCKQAENSAELVPLDRSLIRAGETLFGERRDDILGWESNTYGEKQPALSFSLNFTSAESIVITTNWNLHELAA